ncbi:MAG: efflux RND transporter periplasmic adaptor subunit [Armatimonadota bacterium]|nr:MAG: efflux RND transporter periplasmic adaptor subunit [Armatimonadota bacterium]
MRARRAIAGVVVVVLLGAAAWGAWRVIPRGAAPAADSVEMVVRAVANRQDLLITVDQTGSLSALDSMPVMPEVSGRLVSVTENGVMASAGDLIAMLDPTEGEEQVKQLTREYAETLRKLEQAKKRGESNLAEMGIKVQRARDEAAVFERQQQAILRDLRDNITFQENEIERRREQLDVKRRLAGAGLIAGTEVEREEAGLRAAEFGLQRDRTDYELKKSQAESDIFDRRKRADDIEHDLGVARRRAERDVRMAQNQVENLKLRLDREKEELRKTAITAPTSGLVVLNPQHRRHGGGDVPRAGDRIWAGRQLAQIVDTKHMQVKLELDQARISGVKVGQEAIVEIDALPGESFGGKVVEIGQTARRPPLEGWWGMSSEQTFPVTIELPRVEETKMRPGMRANVRIVMKRIEDVITIPTECVFERDGRFVVYVERDGRYREVTVKIGESSGDYTAIVQGLKEGDGVALNDLGTSAVASAPAQDRPR